MTTIALCVPAWNAAPFLGRLLESAVAQSSAFDEVLVYDDASSDSTPEVAARYGARVIAGSTNRGPSFGKNQLARAAHSEWLHFHDADGCLRPGFVVRARHWMDENSVDVVLFGTEDRDDETQEVIGGRTWDEQVLAADPVAYAIRTTITNCGIYRRSAFLRGGGFDVDDRTKYNEDQAFHLRLALAGLRFRSDSYVGIVIYRREGSMSSGHPIECARAQVEVMKRAATETGTKYGREIGERAWHLAAVCATHSDWQYVRESLSVATRLGYLDPSREHLVLRCLARFSPIAAIGAREWFVRIFKPRLRVGVPQVP